jgi:RNA polymerase sigma factor (sigma-70 family)
MGDEQQGDEAAFRAMIARHAAAIARLCRHHEVAPEARRDLEQDVLVALWRALPAFRGDSSERTWVYRIAHNVAATHVVQAVRRKKREEHAAEAPLEAARPDRTVEARDMLARVSARLRTFDLASQQLVLLALEGCTTAEIAEVSGLSATNVTTRLSRLRRTLMQTDGDDGDHGTGDGARAREGQP